MQVEDGKLGYDRCYLGHAGNASISFFSPGRQNRTATEQIGNAVLCYDPIGRCVVQISCYLGVDAGQEAIEQENEHHRQGHAGHAQR